jgi:hypothetical protein
MEMVGLYQSRQRRISPGLRIEMEAKNQIGLQLVNYDAGAGMNFADPVK